MTMNKLDTMIAIKAEVFDIQEMLNSTDAQVVKVAMEAYLKLVDIFYSENEEMMAPSSMKQLKRTSSISCGWWSWHIITLRIWRGEERSLLIEAMNPGA